MNGYGRRQWPMPQGGGAYNPYSKYPDIAGAVRQFMNSMMMMKQMKQQKQQQTWQRGMEEKKQESLGAYRQAQTEAMQRPKPPSIPARVQEAIWATEQGDVPHEKLDFGLIAKKLDEWRDRPEKKLEEDTTRADTYTRHRNLLKSALTRLGKERTTLNQRSRPSQSELESGVMPERKQAFIDEAKNVEEALNLLSKMESYMESGSPLGKRQEAALKKIIGDIGGVKTGKTLEGIRTSWAKEAESTLQAPQRKQFRNKKTGKLDWFILKDGKWIKE
jgi:hypothetical protein